MSRLPYNVEGKKSTGKELKTRPEWKPGERKSERGNERTAVIGKCIPLRPSSGLFFRLLVREGKIFLPFYQTQSADGAHQPPTNIG